MDEKIKRGSRGIYSTQFAEPGKGKKYVLKTRETNSACKQKGKDRKRGKKG